MENLQKKINSENKTIKVIAITIASICLLFLVFFVVNVKLSEPTVMTLNLPQTSKNITHSKLDKNNTITILLGENGRIIYYRGPLDSPVISPKETKYGEDGIRKELTIQNKNILENSSKLPKYKKLIVIIKPDTKSTYKNLVAILEEMAITKIDTYAIVSEFTPEESKLLASN